MSKPNRVKQAKTKHDRQGPIMLGERKPVGPRAIAGVFRPNVDRGWAAEGLILLLLRPLWSGRQTSIAP